MCCGVAVHPTLQTFRRWLDQKGPFDITIDGANLAFYGENYLGGGFKCWKVKVAYERLQEQYPRAKILVVSESAFQSPKVQSLQGASAMGTGHAACCHKIVR